VSVRSIEDVDTIGTGLIEKRQGRRPEVVALAARRDVAVVRVQDAAMINEPGVAGRILTAMGAAGINVDAVGSSMSSLSFTIDRERSALARRTLRLLAEGGATGLGAINILEQAALLGVVGDGLAGDARIGGRLLSCLGELGIDVALVSHGPGDVGLSCVVAESDLQRALTALHAAFFGKAPSTRAGGRARERRQVDRRDEKSDRRGGQRRTGAGGGSGRGSGRGSGGGSGSSSGSSRGKAR
jgi:aspartokinase